MDNQKPSPGKKLDLSRPTGFRDFLPSDVKKFRRVEEIAKTTIESFGFEEIQTPIVEFQDLFLVRSGEKFKDYSFTFKTPKFRDIEAGLIEGEPGDAKTFVLRPEFTAGVCRFYNQNEINRYPKPVKIYYLGPCFRYDKPAPGRYREFYQLGVELFGSATAKSDAEVIILATRTVEKLGIKDYKVRINDLNILRALLNEFDINEVIQDKIIGLMDNANGDMVKLGLGFIETTQEKIVDGFMDDLNRLDLSMELITLLKEMLLLSGRYDDIKVKALEIFKDKPGTIEALESSNLTTIENMLSEVCIESYVVDLSLARGLDYYTGIVFEIDSPSIGKQKQICGGGRYDRLIEEFGGESIPATGFAFGVDRLVLAAEANGSLDLEESSRRADVFLYAFKDEHSKHLFTIQDRLLSEGIKVELNVMDWNIRKALSFASKLGFKFAIILGEKEIEESTVTLKNLDTEDQDVMPMDEAIKKIKNTLV
ncbi:MAG: histidine--tRNA ligase [Candidatus Hodarchaeota archaeon]